MHNIALIISKLNFGYKYGKPETRPSDKTNPDDLLGSCCKHLLAILSNKKWTNMVAIEVGNYINDQGLEKLRKAIAYDEVQLPSEELRSLGKQGARGKEIKKQARQDEINRYNQENNINNENNEEEELIPKGDNE